MSREKVYNISYPKSTSCLEEDSVKEGAAMLRTMLILAAIVAVILVTGCSGVQAHFPSIEAVRMDRASSSFIVITNRRDGYVNAEAYYLVDRDGHPTCDSTGTKRVVFTTNQVKVEGYNRERGQAIFVVTSGCWESLPTTVPVFVVAEYSNWVWDYSHPQNPDPSTYDAHTSGIFRFDVGMTEGVSVY